MKRSCLSTLAFAAIVQVAFGQNCTWIGGNVGAWSTAANWENGLVPTAAGDTAAFSNAAALTPVTIDANVSVDKISVSNTRLNLYSSEGKSVAFTGDSPEIAVASGAALRVSGAKLVSTLGVKKTGEGKFISVGAAGEGLRFVSHAGLVELEGATHDPLTVITGDGAWESAANMITTGAGTTAKDPYGTAANSLVVGHADAQRSGVNGCRKPLYVGSSFSLSADVEMTGQSAYGFAVAFHNDPRGHLAHTVHVNEYASSLGYGAANSDSSKNTKVVNGFAFGIYNYYTADGVIQWGKNGLWLGNAKSDPLIYTATASSDGKTMNIPRAYSVRIDYDSVLKRAILTLTQDQREIVSGGQANVTWSKAVCDVDLVKLCGSDEAFLSFTYNEGGRNILATLKNLRVDYVDETCTTLTVRKDDTNWENLKRTYNQSADSATGKSPFGTSDGSIRVGYGLTLCGAVTGYKARLPVDGNLHFSGKVTDDGSGAHGYAVVLHNDARGHLAMSDTSAGGASWGYAYNEATKVKKSVAFGIANYAGYNGQVRYGENGVWSKTVTTNPKIITAPRGDNHTSTEVQRKYDFAADYDAAAKTLTLVLSQDQGGTLVVSTNVFANVDVPALCGDDEAYLSLTTEAGGCSVDVAIDDFTFSCKRTPKASTAASGFASFAAENGKCIVSAVPQNQQLRLAAETSLAADAWLSVRNSGGAVDLGAVSAAGSLALAGVPKALRIVPSDNLWENRLCKTDGTDTALNVSPYGENAGSIRTGYAIVLNGSVTGCKERIPVSGNFTVSGKVTENGTGAHGYTIVLHNDPRGHLAHCKPATGGDSLGFARDGDETRVVKSVGLGVYNFGNSNGRIRFGKNGVWAGNSIATDPKINTAPQGDKHGSGICLQRKYDFALTVDATAKTLTMVMSQVQGAETVYSTNVIAGVDVPMICGDDFAYLTITTEAGGCSVDVTIDSFGIDYDSAEPVAFAAANAIEAPSRSVLTLANATVVVDKPEAFAFDVFALTGSAAFSFDGAYRLSPTKVFRNGVRLPYGTYTAADCAWITGEGSVTATGKGSLLIIR